MALDTFTVTGGIRGPDGTSPMPGTLRVWASAGEVTDDAGNKLLVGARTYASNTDGDFLDADGQPLIVLPKPGQAGLSPESFYYHAAFTSTDHSVRLKFDIPGDADVTIDELGEPIDAPLTPSIYTQTLAAKDEAATSAGAAATSATSAATSATEAAGSATEAAASADAAAASVTEAGTIAATTAEETATTAATAVLASKQDVASLDADMAAKIGTDGTATKGALSDAIAAVGTTEFQSADLPRTTGKANGLKYDGTDETAVLQGILTALTNFGGGELALEGIVRCDSQVTIPTTVVGTQLRQAPIRLTGTAQHMPGSAMTTVQYPNDAGLDLRYAGRTDPGCGTTKGSAVVTNTAAVSGDRGNLAVGAGLPDQAWIIAVDPGVSWTLAVPARATGTASLTSFGGRLQSSGYGMLEIDHLQLCNQSATPSSAPLVVATGTTIKAHHNLVMGSTTKSATTCDEDAFVLGGPGQGAALTAGLAAGVAVTSLPVSALPVGVLSGVPITVAPGTSDQATVTTTTAAAAGATSIAIASYTPANAIPVRSAVLLGGSQSATDATSVSVPSAPFQGYGTHISDNHFHRIRRITAGAWASDVWIGHNAWMHNCGSNLAAQPSTLTTGLTGGATVTALAVSALSRAVIAGDVIQVGVSPTSQEFIATADAAAGATSITVTSVTANAAYATGTKAFNTAYLGAAVESHAAAGNANAITVTDNRFGMSGGYTNAIRFMGPTISSSIRGNSQQDSHANNIAVYRFDRGAFSNLIHGGLHNPAIPAVDDWANATHTPSQTYVSGRPNDPLTFPSGFSTIGGKWLPTSGSTSTYSPALAQSSGASWRLQGADPDFWLNHTPAGGSESQLIRVQDSPTGVNLNITVNASNEAHWTNSGGHLKYTAKAGYKVYLGDATLPSNVYAMNGKMYADALVGKAYTTAGRPTAASVGVGGQIFDSTLNKPIWSTGSTWVDAAGATV